MTFSFGRRYFDPGSGRWTTPDPIGFDGGINLYAFVQNNPLAHLDLYGLSIHDNLLSVSTPMVTTPMIAPQQVFTKQLATSPLPEANSSSHSLGSRAKAAAGGTANGLANFVVGSLHDLQTSAFYR